MEQLYHRSIHGCMRSYYDVYIIYDNYWENRIVPEIADLKVLYSQWNTNNHIHEIPYIFSYFLLPFSAMGFGYSLVGKPCENCLHNSTYCDSDNKCLFGCIAGWLPGTCTQRCQRSTCLECILGPNDVEQCSRFVIIWYCHKLYVNVNVQISKAQ